MSISFLYTIECYMLTILILLIVVLLSYEIYLEQVGNNYLCGKHILLHVNLNVTCWQKMFRKCQQFSNLQGIQKMLHVDKMLHVGIFLPNHCAHSQKKIFFCFFFLHCLRLLHSRPWLCAKKIFFSSTFKTI